MERKCDEPKGKPKKVRSVTIRRDKRLSAAERAEAARPRLRVIGDGAEQLPQRPRTRGECRVGVRPCPWTTCPHHLFVDVTNSGSLKLNFPHLEVWQLQETCALDLADRGPQTLLAIAHAMGVSDKRAPQLIEEALAELQAKLDAAGIDLPARQALWLLKNPMEATRDSSSSTSRAA